MIRLKPLRIFSGLFCLLYIFSWLPPGSAQDSDRKVLKKVVPQYPTVLKGMRIGGTVKLNVVIRPDGSVKNTTVVGGNPILAESAQKAVAQWKFSPGATETTTVIAIVFDPNS